MRTPTNPIYRACCKAALASLIIMASFTQASGAPGSLTGITIKDTQTNDTPPVASFTYKTAGTTVTFDAGSSADADGNIVSFRWDFGDGSTGGGTDAVHDYQSYSTYPVSLTTVDNSGGVSILQQEIIISPATWLQDNFIEPETRILTAHSPELGGEWSMAEIEGQIFNVSGGKGLLINTNTGGDIAINNEPPPNQDYTVSVTGVLNSTLYDRLFGTCGRLDRVNKTGYCAYLKGDGKLVIAKYNEDSSIYGETLATTSFSINPYETYTIEMIFSGENLTANLINEGSISVKDSLYKEGNLGLILRRNNSYIETIKSN